MVVAKLNVPNLPNGATGYAYTFTAKAGNLSKTFSVTVKKPSFDMPVPFCVLSTTFVLTPFTSTEEMEVSKVSVNANKVEDGGVLKAGSVCFVKSVDFYVETAQGSGTYRPWIRCSSSCLLSYL